MNYVSVDSSTVDAVAYDEASSTLGVRFKSGANMSISVCLRAFTAAF